jgi:hypothetical protein
MKTTLVIAALSLVSFGVANTATASDYKFKNSGAFTATGSLTVTAAAVSLPCTAVLTGSTGPAKVTGAAFSGLSCLALSASNLPWKMHVNAAHTFTFEGVEVSALVLGVCGPGKVKSQLNEVGGILITGAGLPGLVPCSVSGNFTTSPRLGIIKK